MERFLEITIRTLMWEALQITKYIVGNYIGNYKYKKIMREKVKSSGKSFMQPLAMDKSEDRSDTRCGRYSCRRSRRVEINFSLANEFATPKSAMYNIKTAGQ